MQITGLNFTPKIYQRNNQQSKIVLALKDDSGDTFVKTTPSTNNMVSFGANQDVLLKKLLQDAKNIYVNIANFKKLLQNGDNSAIRALLSEEEAELIKKNNQIVKILYPKMANAVRKIRHEIIEKYSEDVLAISKLFPTVNRRPKTIIEGGKTYKFVVDGGNYNVKVSNGEKLCAEYEIGLEAYGGFTIRKKDFKNGELEFFASRDNVYLMYFKEKGKNLSVQTSPKDDITYVVATLNDMEYKFPMRNSKINGA